MLQNQQKPSSDAARRRFRADAHPQPQKKLSPPKVLSQWNLDSSTVTTFWRRC